jgi:protein-tyrosine-phosphatase
VINAASAGAVRAMARRGLDLSGHLSHQMDSDTVEVADLIVWRRRTKNFKRNFASIN